MGLVPIQSWYQPTDITRTQYTNCCLCSASWRWASSAQNMYRLLFHNKLNIQKVHLVGFIVLSQTPIQHHKYLMAMSLWKVIPCCKIFWLPTTHDIPSPLMQCHKLQWTNSGAISGFDCIYNTYLLLEASVMTQCLAFVLVFYVTICTSLTKQ
jgi:hypothetical protein